MTNKFFEEKVKKLKIILIIGIICMALGLILKISPTTQEQSYILLIIGLIIIFGTTIKYLMFKNDNILEVYEITETDERQIQLRGKSAYLSFVYSTIILAIVSMIFVFLEYYTQLYYVLAILISQYILFIVLSKYYDKNY